MNLSENQIDHLLEFFPDICAGAKNIARILLTEGSCIVAGNECIWRGGIGNFISTKPAKKAFNCIEYTFDIKQFLSSALFKEYANDTVLEFQNKITKLVKTTSDINELLNPIHIKNM